MTLHSYSDETAKEGDEAPTGAGYDDRLRPVSPDDLAATGDSDDDDDDGGMVDDWAI